jgi:hypothetical protein
MFVPIVFLQYENYEANSLKNPLINWLKIPGREDVDYTEFYFGWLYSG